MLIRIPTFDLRNCKTSENRGEMLGALHRVCPAFSSKNNHIVKILTELVLKSAEAPILFRRATKVYGIPAVEVDGLRERGAIIGLWQS